MERKGKERRGVKAFNYNGPMLNEENWKCYQLGNEKTENCECKCSGINRHQWQGSREERYVIDLPHVDGTGDHLDCIWNFIFQQ